MDIRSSPQKLSQFFGSNAARVDRSEVRRIVQDFSSSATDNVVLVGHALFNDLWRMNEDGFGRPQAAVLETMSIAEGIIPIGRQLSLEDLAIGYNIPRQKFHDAGNDAYYTMQVLIMLVVEGVKEQLNPQQRERVSILEALARMPIPGQEIINKFQYSSAVAIAQEKMAKWRRLHPVESILAGGRGLWLSIVTESGRRLHEPALFKDIVNREHKCWLQAQ
ncbi:uncharacterized protein L3040_008671 [Drepanopeziza brunnea f. sp. 'multigermtubi']|uniref:uncharacterized protein n=1 Tax=Drepanopeziza brunnea f. sp. 'multigermtubi' TaxID=698441 RepID=UPI0023A2AB2B|nr:hypothetical protein L3040_008671 [Drepanopeziza brunnea f. sp. 'multigermtubi']